MHFSLDGYRRQFSDGGSQRLVCYPRASLEGLGLQGEVADFLAEVGLPSFAAPHLAFFCDGEQLPTPAGPRDETASKNEGAVSDIALASALWRRWRQIGVTGEGWPLCLSPDEPGAILWLRWPPESQQDAATLAPALPADDERRSSCGRVNSSPRRLAESLWEYAAMVERRSSRPAARRSRRSGAGAAIRRNSTNGCSAASASIPAPQADGYWPRHLRKRAKDDQMDVVAADHPAISGRPPTTCGGA